MKKMSLIMIVFMYLLLCPSGCNAQAADPEPAIVDSTAPPVATPAPVVQPAAQGHDDRTPGLAEEPAKKMSRENRNEVSLLRNKVAVLTNQIPGINIETCPTVPQIRTSITNAFGRRNQERSVLFIPQKTIHDTIAEQISEDMQVMSMILEKTADIAPYSGYGGGTGYGASIGKMEIFYDRSPDVSESIYVEDYGMIFKLNVDFPLVLVGDDEQPKQQVDEDIQDEVWQHSKNKLRGLDEPRKEKENAVAFDAEKVELLKEKLIKAFKHTSNIRNLSGNDRIVFVVSGYVNGKPGRFCKDVVQKTGGDGISVPTSVMTLQALKKDIDAFGSGTMDFETFGKEVSVVVY